MTGTSPRSTLLALVLLGATALGFLSSACSEEPATAPEDEAPTAPIDRQADRKPPVVPAGMNPALFAPHEARETAPESYRVLMATTRGEIEVECVRSWAPRAADRFYNLVKMGYYDGTIVHQAAEGELVAFGLHANKEVTMAWKGAALLDEPVRQKNRRGYLSLNRPARIRNNRSVEVILNLADNVSLDDITAPFGRVVRGLLVADELRSDPEVGPDNVSNMRSSGTGFAQLRMTGGDRIETMSLLPGDN